MKETEIEEKVWQITFDYLKNATPEQWHIYAAWSNYDGNKEGLRWLVDNPQLDRATALLIYWQLGAGYYVQYASEEEAESYQRETYRLVRLIEERYIQGFYANHGIWFEPMMSPGAKPTDYVGQFAVKRPIPNVMLQATAGSVDVDLENLEGYDEGLPFEVAERIFALFD